MCLIEFGLKCSKKPLELVFLIDSSERVGPENFQAVKNFVNALVDQMTLTREATQVAVVLYSHVSMVVVSLQQQPDPDQIKTAIRTMPYLGEGTFTGSIIHQANQVFRGSRPGARKVALVLMDGQTDRSDGVQFEETIPEAQKEGVEVFVVGVLNNTDHLYKFLAVIKTIASDPDEDHTYLREDFRMLHSKEKRPVFFKPLSPKFSMK